MERLPLEQKLGSIRKCPACGAVLRALDSSCGSCDHELSDIDANRSIVDLAAQFDAIEKNLTEKGIVARTREKELYERKARVIRDYPIPNSREDLQQFLYYIQPKLLDSVKPDPNIEDWRIKFNEVMGRAKKAYQDNPQTLREFAEMEAATHSTLSGTLQLRAKRYPLIVGAIAVVAILAVAAMVNSHQRQSRLVECQAKYDQGAKTETARLDKLFGAVEYSFNKKNFAEALAQTSQLRWDYKEACRLDESAKESTLWDSKRSEVAATIQKTMNDEASARKAEADQAAATKQAEMARIDQEKKDAEAKEALTVRATAEQAEASADKEESDKRNAARDKKW